MGLFSRLVGRRDLPPEDDPRGTSDPAAAATPGSVYGTKALRKFMAALTTRPDPVLLDLGPVIGANVSFFGEQLGCKIMVEDLFADVERHTREGTLDTLAEGFVRRLPQADESVDGILCWDLFDFLDSTAAQAVAAEVSRVLRAEGALLGFFSTAPIRETTFTKFVVVDEGSLRHRPYGPVRTRSRVLQNRDIIKLFEGLRVSDSFLLQTNLREIVFRRPAYLTGARQDA